MKKEEEERRDAIALPDFGRRISHDWAGHVDVVLSRQTGVPYAQRAGRLPAVELRGHGQWLLQLLLTSVGFVAEEDLGRRAG